MPATTGHIELERNIDSITVGIRHRKDLGDVDRLARSIDEVGLLQPITITPDGVLVCGRRRLEALRRLGASTVKVWVRSGVSDELSHVLAQQAENMERKPLNTLESAALFREVTLLLEEDAARRQEATRFKAASDESSAEDDGAGHCPAPQGGGGDSDEGDGAGQRPAPRGEGDTRYQAAQIVTNTQSYHRLEKVNWLEDVRADENRPESVRKLAAEALARIGEGGPVDPAYKRVRAADRLATAPRVTEPEVDPELRRLAEESLERAKREERSKRAAARRRSNVNRTKPVRAFVLTWGELVGWSEGYDVDEVAARLTEEEWAGFEQVVAETIAFAERLREARHQRAASA
jgi:ParB family chromosome partitioning protein